MTDEAKGKSFYDRANFFIAAQAIFANAFATMAFSSNLIGLFKLLPVIICCVGISLNLVWIYSRYIPEETRTFFAQLNLKDIIYTVAPFILTVTWIAILVVFSLQAFGIIRITL